MRLPLHLAWFIICGVRGERPAAARSALQPRFQEPRLSGGEAGHAPPGPTRPVLRAEPLPGSQTWPLVLGDRCGPRNAYACGAGRCCCRFGCSYDVEKDSCTACHDDDPDVAAFHIPSSHLWEGRAQGKCTKAHSHVCGLSCCCNAEYLWSLETRECQHVTVVQEPPEEAPQIPVPREDPIPGSQTWGTGETCASRNAYLCNDGRHCCCRMGCTYDVEYDECRGCSDGNPDVTNFHIPASQLWKSRMEENICTAPHSHLCGKSCCCNAEWRWDLDKRECVKATVLQTLRTVRPLGQKPPEPAPIPGSQIWESCQDRHAYSCGNNHCCCMFGCTYDVEEDACTGCKANDPLVEVFHIPASHRWPERKQEAECADPFSCGRCDAKLSHPCGWSCCCNAGHVWDLEQRSCVAYKPTETPSKS